jgi:hypothetical protein
MIKFVRWNIVLKNQISSFQQVFYYIKKREQNKKAREKDLWNLVWAQHWCSVYSCSDELILFVPVLSHFKHVRFTKQLMKNIESWLFKIDTFKLKIGVLNCWAQCYRTFYWGNYCHSTVLSSFCIIKLYCLSNYCRMTVNCHGNFL